MLDMWIFVRTMTLPRSAQAHRCAPLALARRFCRSSITKTPPTVSDKGSDRSHTLASSSPTLSSSTTARMQDTPTTHRHTPQALRQCHEPQHQAEVALKQLAILEAELQSVKRELLGARLRCTQLERELVHARLHKERAHTALSRTSDDDCAKINSTTKECEECRLGQSKLEDMDAAAMLRSLQETDRAALQTATELRYTGFALQCSHDNLQVELRRLVSMGLTDSEVDQAAIEAGARQYIRANIGHRAVRIRDEPAVALNVEVMMQSRSAKTKTEEYEV